MPIADRLRQYLDRKHIIYDVHELAPFTSLLQASDAAGITAASVVKTVVLKDEVGLVMVVMLATHSLDVDALSKLLHRRMELATEAQIKQVFPDCVPRFVPPLGEPYGVRTIVDDALVACDGLYFSGGDASHLVQVNNKDFFNLLSNAWLAGNFSRAIGSYDERAAAASGDTAVTGTDIKKRIQALKELPAMPAVARQIFELRANPLADVERLGKLVELDPSLAAQVIRYARSPFFSYRGKVDSVNTAISRVLGFEMVMNLALGIASARPFKIPAIGPLGLNAFWRHATYSAALVQALGRELPHPMRPPAGMSYLAGLLHNMGHLLLGHLFKPEFCMLNNAVSAHPGISVVEQEMAMLGIEHGELGAWLMESWNMPEEIIVATREHHNASYNGPHAVYARLTLLADHMLKEHGIGDAPTHELPAEIMAELGLEEIQIVMVMSRILEGCEGLNAMARNLAAA